MQVASSLHILTKITHMRVTCHPSLTVSDDKHTLLNVYADFFSYMI